ncbi:DUF6192 family protein [Streptomyces sp. NPDC090077]|uniref:DUF6192 family protein n=1 Tax=Streptomyces sp. NPDC090077 TaxID=3365938 RepID=UPI0038211E8D
MNRRVHQYQTPIHTLAKDEAVAAVVTGDLLRRPTVVAQLRAEDRVSAVHTLVEDEKVAASVTGDLLKRPTFVAQVCQPEKTPGQHACPVAGRSPIGQPREPQQTATDPYTARST